MAYKVAYSGRVQNDLKDLVIRASSLGLGSHVLSAAKEIDRRLKIYPQFGQPLRDLVLVPEQLWIGVVPPLVVQYIVDDALNVVMVVVPLKPLPNLGL